MRLGLEADNPEAFNPGTLNLPEPQPELCGHLTDPGLMTGAEEKRKPK